MSLFAVVATVEEAALVQQLRGLAQVDRAADVRRDLRKFHAGIARAGQRVPLGSVHGAFS